MRFWAAQSGALVQSTTTSATVVSARYQVEDWRTATTWKVTVPDPCAGATHLKLGLVLEPLLL